jgi:hypothetical protein
MGNLFGPNGLLVLKFMLPLFGAMWIAVAVLMWKWGQYEEENMRRYVKPTIASK